MSRGSFHSCSDNRWLDANKFHSLCLLKARESIPGSLFAIDQISEAGMVVCNNHLARIEVLQDQPIMLTKDGSDFRGRNVVRKNYPVRMQSNKSWPSTYSVDKG
eukprot:scaffold1875_cov82-Cylindrotheca_fusiformis.AAC.2